MFLFVSAFLCYLTKKRWQRKQKIFLFEEKKHLLKKSPSTNLPMGQPFILEVVIRATSTAQALSVTSLSLLKITSVQKQSYLLFYCFRMALFDLLVFVLELVFLLAYGWFFFYLLVFVSAFLCYSAKKRWQRKRKNFLRESFTKERLLTIPDYHRPQAQLLLRSHILCDLTPWRTTHKLIVKKSFRIVKEKKSEERILITLLVIFIAPPIKPCRNNYGYMNESL